MERAVSVKALVGMLAIALLAITIVLADTAPADATMPGETGEILVFGHVDDVRGLYLVSLDPLGITELPIEAHDLDPYDASWSPTGDRLAFIRFDPNANESGLWVHDLVSGQTTLLRIAPPNVDYQSVSWSPGGQELAVGTIIHNGPADYSAGLLRLDTEGALIDEISLPANFSWWIRWSPSGDHILVDLGWPGEEDFWYTTGKTCLLDPDTGSLDCILDPGGLWPDWAPDGRRFAAGHDPDGLGIFDLAGNEVHRFEPYIPERMTTWSPDGRFIAYPWYLGEREIGQYGVGVVDLETNERSMYVVGIRNILAMWWRPIRPTSGFLDVPDSHTFASDVAWLADRGVTSGCNRHGSLFCPNRPATRGEVAALLRRALGGIIEPTGPPISFEDTSDSVFAADAEWMSSVGVTKGCNPPTNSRFCPDDEVTRGQMAAFLVRALGYTDNAGGNLFIDDDDSIFENDIDRLRAAGVTKGCNPSQGNTMFCPSEHVTRGQIAALLHRALG